MCFGFASMIKEMTVRIQSVPVSESGANGSTDSLVIQDSCTYCVDITPYYRALGDLGKFSNSLRGVLQIMRIMSQNVIDAIAIH